MLFASPHWRVTRSLAWVSCCHSLACPAHTSGGAAYDSRTNAMVLPSFASDIDGENPPAPAARYSPPLHSVAIFLFWGSTLASPTSPPTNSVNIIFFSGVHAIQL